ncbi:Rne/Rng family ribonuclease [Aphanizomenon flos-aquae NRERC-008]|jgi:ribonuclease E|uniref:Rne/Rng family ribonuclease n=1 Tax=Aphanizomenon flos-aquae FACHB-1249 TaxID=2692889 RepID=A0ABR8ISH7_APHFL|nr:MULTISPECIES: Rne/Rng family ribonuclease [Aphanizomenon]MCE2904577.1 Rne/Rng family ribonuclease [Anabaena sp. CoA2_C59]MDJ0504390.1 Rne/Rng family ribonuclease [Nostocales cyanobacterium LE14-WE12]MBD2392230.1 Rne/Rng family ribonuclease [Aphanizomenon flos-aquae FACHB-1171]MBD2558271.1 Rne/Rng family ribonuclease [Aphanizomenon flos-aquae FACHB-1290]MBD2633477.1 Rne/Rng family ribonuclease [Aphanizomenon sp. FACHB-1399]
MPKQIIIAEQHQIAAVFSEDQIQELVVATGHHQIGDIYLGVVENILPGIDAAFVNIGDPERNGFIHVTDLGPLRLKRSAAAITELLTPQQKTLVQVMKEPTGSKGPRLTGNITLPGRYVVLMPYGRGVNLSRRIKSESERNRLRALAILVKPAGMGLLVRTEAEGKPEEAIIEDLEVLQKQWEIVQQEAVTSRAPALLNRDDDFIQRVLRDMYGGDVNRIVVDSSTGLKRVKQYLQNWSGGQTPQGLLIDHHRDRSPILEYFRINAAVREALRPRVDLPSGGYIIIQPTEALTVIDVNSGSFTRSATARETVLWTNCEAAAEIARQLRLRNIAGVIVVDFIDMESRRDQMQVLEHFNKSLKADKARPQIAQLTELGLVELTRKRQGQNIYELFGEPCPTCGGLGHILRLPGEMENRLPVPAVDIPERFVPIPQREIRTVAAPTTRTPDSGSVGQSVLRDTYDGFGDGFEAEPEFNSLHLINHPSYQELNDSKRRTRTRRSRIGANAVNGKDESRLPTNPLSFVNDADLDLEEPELPIPEIAPPTINKSGWTERPERAKVKLEPIKVEPPEVVTVMLSTREQDTYAEMGISPLLKLDREGKNPRSVIINVVQPGQSPVEETEFIPETIVTEKTIPEVVTIKLPTPTFELEEEPSFPPLVIVPEVTIVPQEREIEPKTEETNETEKEKEIEFESNHGSIPNRRRRRRSSALDTDGFGL